MYSIKLENIKKVDDFLIHPTKLNQEETNNLNITKEDIKTLIKILPTKKTTDADGFITEFYLTFKEDL